MSRGADTDDNAAKEIVPATSVATAVTRIAAPMWDVWRVIVAFDQYAQWHPVLSLDATSEQVVVGRRFRPTSRAATPASSTWKVC